MGKVHQKDNIKSRSSELSAQIHAAARIDTYPDWNRWRNKELGSRAQAGSRKLVTGSLAATFREHAKRIPISEGVCLLHGELLDL